MRALPTSLFLLILSCILSAQVSKRIVSYDFALQLYDTIPGVLYDSTLAEDFVSGDNRGNSIVQLPSQPVFPLALNPNYSERFPAADSFNVDKYPFSSSVALRVVTNDSITNNCSGSLVSHNLVLTANHCFSYFINDTSTPNFYVFPAFNNGKANALFDSVRVSKLFYFEGSDLAFALLEESIGYNTGWIGFGYARDSILHNKLFHKISYPAYDIFGTKNFNGDTMFYENGYLNVFLDQYLGVTDVTGMGGQSGSSWFTFKILPITYGVTSSAHQFRHQRITPEEFYSITNIQKDLSEPEPPLPVSLKVFPNPAKDHIRLILPSDILMQNMSIFNSAGFKTSASYTSRENEIRIDLSNHANGLYFIQLESDQRVYTHKILITR
ncbi:V8-like Glu-specific endopeptidase [Owenweeksia hongkongensis DSM 17368]|uniref:V8-like Glu-specific endopeptidase n=1 Tax=Owenweeksia hongkongensis (strain DSM 17368 / CIP 108786 / JCM 12287 / NRRL B-23963 / UST20020801) TaxID=926562 RepID=G8R0B1_OWEHD|nr:T9SS type A sorting domain-containing protein [Owenweeksia hongkongensis]AEV31571.1 V8-like Glu-specific endopeptidase [Owenweeksia hongkongensis DSM 17368]